MKHLGNLDNFQKSVHLYKQLENIDSKVIKGIESHDRKIISVALKNITQRDTETNQMVISTSDFETTFTHLKNLKGEPKLGIFERIARALKNFFLGRISSEKLLQEKAKAENSLANDRKELVEVPGKILKKKEYLAEWEEMVRFNQADALPLYKDILNFFSNLPLDQAAAQSLVDLKLKETQDQVKKATEERREPSYMKILEKEILANLTKLAKYKEIQGQTSFGTEVNAARRAWGNAVKLASDESVSKPEMAKLEKEIENLEARRISLEKKLDRLGETEEPIL